MKEAKQKKRPRAERIHHDITVHDWEGFKKTWKATNFLTTFDTLPPEEKQGFLIEKLYQLVSQKDKACYLFPHSLKPQVRQHLVRLVDSQNLKDQLSYQYEGLFMDKPKQLLIYKKRISSLIIYLEKYRLPTEYKNLQNEVTNMFIKLEQLQIKQNILISEEREENMEEIKAKIEHEKEATKEKMEKYWSFIDKIMKDFREKETKKTLSFLNVRHGICAEIKKLTVEHELYFSYKYTNISEFDLHKDINILKEMPPKEDEYEANGDYNDEEEEKISEKKVVDELLLSKQEQTQKFQQKILPPTNIELSIVKITENGAMCEVQFDKDPKRPVEEIVVTVHKPKTELQSKYMKVVQVKNEEWENFAVDLHPVRPGFCSYALKARNKVGESDWSYVQVWNEVAPRSENQEGIFKIQKRDYDFYGLGNSTYGLIPIQDVCSTEDKWMKMKLKGVDFSASTQISICNSAGDVGSWGAMYVPQPEEEEEKTGYVEVHMPKYTIYAPCLILSNQSIRKVSCGEGYCLMADCFGKVWSFGANDSGQLGLDHTDPSKDTTDPAVIRMFVKEKILITDVIASYFGGSFAIDNEGRGYRWGTNQMQVTDYPVKDTYKNIINYEYSETFLNKISTPQPLGNKTISQPIKSIHPGVEFVFALTQSDQLYGWGKCQYLGMGEMLNSHFGNLYYICNPIPILKNVKKVSTGTKHTLVLNGEGELYGWGNSQYFVQSSSTFYKEPSFIRKYDGLFASGPDFTVFQEEGKLRVVGDRKNFKSGIYERPEGRLVKVVGTEGMLMIMVDNTK